MVVVPECGQNEESDDRESEGVRRRASQIGRRRR